MGVDVDSPTSNYHNPLINAVWEDLAQGYFNYGRIDPDHKEGVTLKQANDDMVDYIIAKLGISNDSFLLDMGCGMGMYTVQIAKRTGCRFVGTDINMEYLEKCRNTAAQFGVAGKGEFLYSKFGEMPAAVKQQTFTHIISLGAMFYGHSVLGAILRDMEDCCDSNTRILIWDFVRVAQWADCQVINKHLKLEQPILSKEEVLDHMKHSQIQLTGFEDFTKYIIPGYDFMIAECKKRDPGMELLTFSLVRDGFVEGKIAYVIYYCKLKGASVTSV